MFNAFRNIAKHHFLEIETECGCIFTLEKTLECILLQSCAQPVADAVPVIRRQRDGEERPKSKLIVEDRNPRNTSILDIIQWIHDNYELREPYNVVDSNCQDFCKNLWSVLTERTYPNPSKVGKNASTETTGNIWVIFGPSEG